MSTGIRPRTTAQMIHLMRCTSERTYGVKLVDGVLHPVTGDLGRHLEGRRALIVTTPTVARLHGSHVEAMIKEGGLAAHVLVLECTEERKGLEQVDVICREAITRGLDRRSVIVALGGGVCSDIVSVAASLIRRGIACVRVPTTLIGQIDAGIGLKGAVNIARKKSFIGCFSPPEAVFIDPAFLGSLPDRAMRVGFAEIIKMALVRDRSLFELVEEHHQQLAQTRFVWPRDEGRAILRLSVLRMLEELETNPYEDQTYERLVDMGHTFSPNLEAASSFSIHHGEAVAIDTALTVTIAESLGIMSKADCDRTIELLVAVGLPIWSPLLTPDLCQQALRDTQLHRGGAINLVTPTEIGTATFLRNLADLPPAVLEQSIARLAQRTSSDTVAA